MIKSGNNKLYIFKMHAVSILQLEGLRLVWQRETIQVLNISIYNNSILYYLCAE
jgi:hypothetical protein